MQSIEINKRINATHCQILSSLCQSDMRSYKLVLVKNNPLVG